jgi:hypothetical protein
LKGGLYQTRWRSINNKIDNYCLSDLLGINLSHLKETHIKLFSLSLSLSLSLLSLSLSPPLFLSLVLFLFRLLQLEGDDEGCRQFAIRNIDIDELEINRSRAILLSRDVVRE